MILLNRIMVFFQRLRHSFYRTPISAIHDDDLIELLTSLGIATQLDNGEITCQQCGGLMNRENLWAIQKTEDGINLFCSNRNCISSLQLKE